MQGLDSAIVVTIESSKGSQKNFQKIRCQILKKRKMIEWKKGKKGKQGKKEKSRERCRKLRNGIVSTYHEHDTL